MRSVLSLKVSGIIESLSGLISRLELGYVDTYQPLAASDIPLKTKAQRVMRRSEVSLHTPHTSIKTLLVFCLVYITSINGQFLGICYTEKR